MRSLALCSTFSLPISSILLTSVISLLRFLSRLKIPTFLVSPHSAATSNLGSFYPSPPMSTFCVALYNLQHAQRSAHSNQQSTPQCLISPKQLFLLLFLLPLLMQPKILWLSLLLPPHIVAVNTVSNKVKIAFWSWNKLSII